MHVTPQVFLGIERYMQYIKGQVPKNSRHTWLRGA